MDFELKKMDNLVIDVIPDGFIMSNVNPLENFDKFKVTFIPDSNSYSNLNIENKIQSNDIYEKYNATAIVKGELICCKDKTKITTRSNKIIYESYEEYLDIILNRDKSKDQWIYNIIDGIAENEFILYSDEDFLLVPNYTWDKKTIEKLHLLAIIKDRNLRTIRDLNNSHIDLLEKIKETGIMTLINKYEVDREEINIYFHYEPSTYQLHVHFTNVNNCYVKNSVESSHHIDNVIFNLSIKSDYYKIIKMIKRV